MTEPQRVMQLMKDLTVPGKYEPTEDDIRALVEAKAIR